MHYGISGAQLFALRVVGLGSVLTAFITISNPRTRAITCVFLFYPNILQTSNIYTLYWVCKRLATLILVIISNHRKQVSPTNPSLTLDWRSCLRLCICTRRAINSVVTYMDTWWTTGWRISIICVICRIVYPCIHRLNFWCHDQYG